MSVTCGRASGGWPEKKKKKTLSFSKAQKK